MSKKEEKQEELQEEMEAVDAAGVSEVEVEATERLKILKQSFPKWKTSSCGQEPKLLI